MGRGGVAMGQPGQHRPWHQHGVVHRLSVDLDTGGVHRFWNQRYRNTWSHMDGGMGYISVSSPSFISQGRVEKTNQGQWKR